VIFFKSTAKKLEERLEKAERDLASLKLEWLETQDKVHRWMHRAVARERVDAAEWDRRETQPQDFSRGDYPAPLDPVSKMLLARRRNVAPGTTNEGGDGTEVPPLPGFKK